jgi:hypothetical protein
MQAPEVAGHHNGTQQIIQEALEVLELSLNELKETSDAFDAQA